MTRNGPTTLMLKNPITQRKRKPNKVRPITERDLSVLKYRFGLMDGRQHTLLEIGKQFNVTRERIRQIEANALRKMGLSKKRWTSPAQIATLNIP